MHRCAGSSLLLALLVVLPARALAQSQTTTPAQQPTTALTFPVYGGYWTDGYDSSLTFGGGLIRPLTDHWDIQADLSFARWGGATVRTTNGATRYESDSFLLISASFVRRFTTQSPRVMPFVGFGPVFGRLYHGGYTDTHEFFGTPITFEQPGDSDAGLTAQAIGGAMYRLSDRVALRGEGRFHLFAMDDTLASLSFVGGVVFCPGNCR